MAEHTHSPFHVVEQFLSPGNCEKVISELGITVPSLDENDKPIRHERFIKDIELRNLIQDALLEEVAEIQTRYRGIIAGMDTPVFRQYFEDASKPCEPHGCESSKYMRKKWVKVRDIDLVGFIWLKDFGGGVPLDPRHEVYGGKLEFPAYNFSLIPQRGTMVLFPAGPHFITAISPVLVGSMELLKFCLKLTEADGAMWHYQPSNFAGTYQDWF